VLATTEQTIPSHTEHASHRPQSAGPGPDAFGAQGRSPASVHSMAVSVSEATAKETLRSISDWAMPGRARMAERYAKIGQERNSAWHKSRALSLGVSIAERVAHCGQETITLENPTTGQVLDRPVECRQRLCQPCNSARSKRTAGRLLRAFATLDQQEAKRGRHKEMFTLTVKHSGSAAVDSQRLQGAWKRMRASFYARQVSIARAATGDPKAKPRRPGFAFVRVLELAGGRDKTGHAHLHVVAYLPRWNDWKWWQQAWRKAVWCADCEIQADLDWNIPYDCMGVGNVQFAELQKDKAAQVGFYVAKVANYVSKTSADLEALQPEAAGDFLGETIGRRWVTTSVGFWPVVLDRPREWVLQSMPEAKSRGHLKDWWTKVSTMPGTGPPGAQRRLFYLGPA